MSNTLIYNLYAIARVYSNGLGSRPDIHFRYLGPVQGNSAGEALKAHLKNRPCTLRKIGAREFTRADYAVVQEGGILWNYYTAIN